MQGRKKLISTAIVVIVVMSIYFASAPIFNWWPHNVRTDIPKPEFHLDYQFVRNVTENLSHIVHKDPSEIERGRAMGSWGEINASEYIKGEMDKIHLEKVHRELINGSNLTIEYGVGLQYIDDILWVHDYGLKINCENYPYPKNMPIEEFFPYASAYGGYEWLPDNVNYNFSDQKLKVFQTNIIFWKETDGIKKLWPKTDYDFIFIDRIPTPEELYNTSELSWEELKNTLETLGIWEVFVDFLGNMGINLPNELLFKSVSKHMNIVSFFSWTVICTYIWRTLNTLSHSATCKGLILYDSNNDTYFMFPSLKYWHGPNPDKKLYSKLIGSPALPILSINGSAGTIIENCTRHDPNSTIDFYLNQTYREVKSYNVIGNITNSSTDKTIIICNHYDSWWGECAGDSAVSDGIMLAIAKYFINHNLTPPYNLAFIAFGGEEYLMRGSIYHERIYENKEYSYVISLNQLGYEQEYPPVFMGLFSNDDSTLSIIEQIAEESGYTKRTGHKIKPEEGSTASDDAAFNVKWRKKEGCITLCLSKNRNWSLYHRSGLNHTKGDAFEYINQTNLEAVSDLALNITYGLIYMERVWEPKGFIPFIIALIIIVVAIALILRKKRGI